MYGSPTLHQNPETGLTESWEYDSQGRLKSATAGGMRYEYSYYSNGLVKEKKASGRTLLSYAYDLDGNKVSRRDLTGKETGYAYNKDGLLTAVMENGRILAAYTYHVDGNVDRLTIGKSLITQYGYDTDRNLQSIKTTDGTSVLTDSTFSYDGNANRIEKKGMEGLTRYSYDANNRLIEVQYPRILGSLKGGSQSGTTAFERLSYDKAGNRIRRVTESLTEQYHYDNCNRLTRLDKTPTDLSKPQEIHCYSYDKQGNMLSDGNNIYSYDGFNRLSEVKTTGGGSQKNRYDAEGLRHEMEENGQLVKFLYNENRKVEAEEESSGNIIRYIRGLGIISSDCESARTYYHYASDEQGSITHILEGECKEATAGFEENDTITTGERQSRILNRYTYDAFGNTIDCEEQVHNRFRYNGEQYDPVTSQYYLRARFYNPVIARFTQEDTYYGDGLNLYQYCANNPVIYRDPSGHNICPTQRNLYHNLCQEYMRQHGLNDYSQIPKTEKQRMYKEMRAALGLSGKNTFTESSQGGTASTYSSDFKHGLNSNNILNKPITEWTNAEIQRAIDSIHNAQFQGNWWGNLSPMAIIVDSNGRVVLTKNGGPVRLDSPAGQMAIKIFGGNVQMPSGKGSNYKRVNGDTDYRHAEARAIQAFIQGDLSIKFNTNEVRLACSHYSCGYFNNDTGNGKGCTLKIHTHNIKNITESAQDHNDRIGRTYVADLWELD